LGSRVFAITILFSASLLSANSHTNTSEAPHIVIVVADDLGWNDVGYNGSEIRTPALDQLAQSGIRLDRFYAHPYCSPTRSALMTGQSPLRNGILRPINKHAKLGLPLDRTLLSQHFQNAGYRTHLIGKWHLGHATREQLPNARGFDEFYGFVTGGIGFWDKVHGGGYDWQRDGKTVRDDTYSTHLITKEAVRVIQKQPDTNKPLFMMANFNAPHLPNEAPPETIASYREIEDPRRRTHAAMVTELDTGVQAIVDALQAANIYDNTLILFLSDNGGLIPGPPRDLSRLMIDRDGVPLGPGDPKPERLIEFMAINSNEGGSSNAPLLRGKGSVYEGGIRVPALVSWPRQFKARTIEAMITVEDVLPTLLKLAGLNFSNVDLETLDGADQSALLQDKGATAAHTYVAIGNDGQTFIDWPWKLLIPSRASPLLFNLDEDPTEQTNLATQSPETVTRLQQAFNKVPRGKPIAAGMSPEFIWDPDFFGGKEDRLPWADLIQ
jgi:arylsulfatase A-like enzyme